MGVLRNSLDKSQQLGSQVVASVFAQLPALRMDQISRSKARTDSATCFWAGLCQAGCEAGELCRAEARVMETVAQLVPISPLHNLLWERQEPSGHCLFILRDCLDENVMFPSVQN